MTEAEVLSTILLNEGGFKNDPANDPADPTNFGITAQTLGNWRKLGRRATVEEVRALTPDEAKQIYRKIFIEDPGFVHDKVPDEDLRLQLVDFGVNSGPGRAIRWLQRIIECHTTGVMDEETVEALQQLRNAEGRVGLNLLAIVNDALVAARCYMIDRAVDTKLISAKNEEGLESRALSFFLSKPDPEPPVLGSGSERRSA